MARGFSILRWRRRQLAGRSRYLEIREMMRQHHFCFLARVTRGGEGPTRLSAAMGGSIPSAPHININN